VDRDHDEKKKQIKGKDGVDENDQDGDAAEVPAPDRYVSRRHGRRNDDVDAEGKPVMWMITFTDVMALMLTFFVMLFSMSAPVQEEWEDMTAALFNEFNTLYGASLNRGPVDDINLDRINFDQALDINYLEVLLEAIAGENESLADVQMIKQPGRLILSLPQDLLFKSGDATITDDGARALYALGGTLSRIKNKVQIVGHADPRPVQGGENAIYDSNWDLSMMRAARVAGVMNSVGYERHIDIIGSAGGRYEDLSAIDNEEQRLDLARRVDIILMNHDGRKRELLFDLISP